MPAVGAAAVCQLSLVGAVTAGAATTAAHKAAQVWVKPNAIGNLDCNAMSPVQRTTQAAKACTDIRGALGVDNKWTWGGRFYDNGRYIGHDEPDTRFLSSVAGSGNNVTWHETLGRDPAAAPTVKNPGHDVNHWAELSIAPWFSMALCDPYSEPLLPCTPESDANAPAITTTPVPGGVYPGAGSSFLEMQFYPPGMAPFADNISCDNTHWCASLHINDLECTVNFLTCNPNCIEPTNFAFIQTNGVPTGPPSPQLADLATNTPNKHTLLMNPGDRLTVHIWDAPVPGHPGQRALETSILDNTTGQRGFMQASGANGFMATNINDCSGTPFNYEPEYSTAAVNNIVPWAADQVDVSTQYETGHFIACSSVSKPISVNTVPGYSFVTDITWNKCHGPYENAGSGGETNERGDAFCYSKGDTHFGQAPPNIVTACEDNAFQNGDLDYDGNPYWPDWPTSATPNLFPATFRQAPPTTVGGAGYSRFQIQTDAALSESTCAYPNTTGCKVPPPTAPGKFYPYWTLVGSCVWEFGNVRSGNTFGKDAQYGSVPPGQGYPQLMGPIMRNPCKA
ncbi:MAG: hypothetical protein JOY82_10690 [Streptosporangiaceae bacterium]|nr:hypothetical protein [Streptosporangiaceae bacterium]MBV9854971.1 hypothetical protein [Streptosporangiaceae bacterium]